MSELRNKIIEVLHDELGDVSNCKEDGSWTDAIPAAAARLEQLLQPTWIRVEEKSPPDVKYVLALTQRGKYHIARTYISGRNGLLCWMDNAGDYPKEFFTHWMSLPAEPSENGL